MWIEIIQSILIALLIYYTIQNAFRLGSMKFLPERIDDVYSSVTKQYLCLRSEVWENRQDAVTTLKNHHGLLIKIIASESKLANRIRKLEERTPAGMAKAMAEKEASELPS